MDVLVAEVSSFQLHYIRDFRPDVQLLAQFRPRPPRLAPRPRPLRPGQGSHLGQSAARQYRRGQRRRPCGQRRRRRHPPRRRSRHLRRRRKHGHGHSHSHRHRRRHRHRHGHGYGYGTGTGIGKGNGTGARTSGNTTTADGTPLASPPTWRTGADGIEGPDGFVLKAVDLPRSLPHDLANTAAALAVALAAGATPGVPWRRPRTTAAPAPGRTRRGSRGYRLVRRFQGDYPGRRAGGGAGL